MVQTRGWLLCCERLCPVCPYPLSQPVPVVAVYSQSAAVL